MSACPMSAVMTFRNRAPSSPAAFMRVQDSANPRPSSPTIRVGSPMTLPSIATTTCLSPSSPNTTRSFSFTKCPASPISKRRTAQIAPPSIPNTTSNSTPSSLSVSSNDREQPVATCPVAVAAPPGGKRKLGKGCSLLDWIRLCRSKKGELGAPGGEKKPVTLAELAEHNTEDDAWTAIRGKVYNITHYIRFHPGGKDDLMKGAGIDCSILFDEVHSYVNVESTLKACFVGPLVANSPNTQRRKDAIIVSKAAAFRKESATSTSLIVPKPLMIPDGMNKQAVPRKLSMPVDTLSGTHLLTEAVASRKNSLELSVAPRKNSMAAHANEEPDGLRQVSPESPIRPVIGNSPPKKSSTASLEAAEGSSMRLIPPPTRIRRSSEPHPRFHWVQSEMAVMIHLTTNNVALKNSDIVLDINERTLEAAIFMNDWVFELNIELSHTVLSSQVIINCGRVEISLKKETPHQQWDVIGEFLEGHNRLTHKSRRDIKYRTTHVESITTVTPDTKLFILRLPAASYMNVPTGHHLSIKADVNGEAVERSYTPVSSLEMSKQKNGLQQEEGETIELMIKLYKDGKMSGFLSNLKEGDEVVVSDPDGTFDAPSRLASASDILLLAAGSGFTPMVKILHEASTELMPSSLRPRRILSVSEASGEEGELDRQAPELPPLVSKICDDGPTPSISPKTVRLIFANKKECDVMWKEELNHLQETTAGRFSVTHILSDADKSWSGKKGRVCETLLGANLPAVNGKNHESALVCVCGPEQFTQKIVDMLLDLDYPDECIHIFQ